MLYCITRANFLFSLRTVLVSIYRTRYNYAHNDFCTQCDFISLRGAQETGGSLLLPMGQGEGMWCRGGFSYWGSSSKMFSCSVWSHGVFRLVFFVLTIPFSCLTLFHCSRVSSTTASATGSFRKMWFDSFSRTEESHWLICHLFCLGNQSLKSLLNNIPKGHFSSSLSCCFCLYLFGLAGYCYCGLSLFPTHRAGSLDQKKDVGTLRGTRNPVCMLSQVNTQAARLGTRVLCCSLFPVPWILCSLLLSGLKEDENKLCGVLFLGPNSLWSGELPKKSGIQAFSLFRLTRNGHHGPGHQRIVLLQLLLYKRGTPSPNPFKALAVQRKAVAACEKLHRV